MYIYVLYRKCFQNNKETILKNLIENEVLCNSLEVR